MPASVLQGGLHTYQVLRRLGQGAFGEVRGLRKGPALSFRCAAPWQSERRSRSQVSLALVLETGEVVALKRIHIRNTSGVPDVVVREIKALQSVTHPNVVALLDVFPKVRRLAQPAHLATSMEAAELHA
jgi:cell cycle related kinase